MAYTAPTVDDFRARFPRFTEPVASDQIVTMALTRAARMVDESWTEDDFAEARMLYAAAWLTNEGIGGGAEAQAAASGAANFKVMKSGGLSLERFDKGATGSTDPVLATADGQAFEALRRLNMGGPRVTGGALSATGWSCW